VIAPRTVDGNTYRMERYRPRIEGLFARIERWTNLAHPADSYWRACDQNRSCAAVFAIGGRMGQGFR